MFSTFLPPSYSLQNLYLILMFLVAFLKYNSYWISAWPISIAWYPFLDKSQANTEAVGPRAININLSLLTFKTVFNILSYTLKACFAGHIILFIDFALLNKSFPIPTRDLSPSTIMISLPSQIFFNFLINSEACDLSF